MHYVLDGVIIMIEGKRYTDVVEMVRDLTGDEAFVEELEKTITEFSGSKFLMVVRGSTNITKEELAERAGWTIEYIDYLESSKDCDITVWDMIRYVKACGFTLHLIATEN